MCMYDTISMKCVIPAGKTKAHRVLLRMSIKIAGTLVPGTWYGMYYTYIPDAMSLKDDSSHFSEHAGFNGVRSLHYMYVCMTSSSLKNCDVYWNLVYTLVPGRSIISGYLHVRTAAVLGVHAHSIVHVYILPLSHKSVSLWA